jgi:hypothetical protein
LRSLDINKDAIAFSVLILIAPHMIKRHEDDYPSSAVISQTTLKILFTFFILGILADAFCALLCSVHVSTVYPNVPLVGALILIVVVLWRFYSDLSDWWDIAFIGLSVLLLVVAIIWPDTLTLKLVFSGAALGSALMWSLAWFAAGSAMGFLFGLPKVSDDTSQEDQSRLRNLHINKNIQEISDWLTKIIVGVGLVQLKSIPPKLRTLSDWFAAWGGESRELGLTSILYFTILGFLATYLVLRLYLTGAFSDADGGEMTMDAVDVMNFDITIPTPQRPGDNINVALLMTPEKERAARRIARMRLESLTSTQGVWTWAKANLLLASVGQSDPKEQAELLENTLKGYSKACTLDGRNPALLFEYAIALYIASDHDDTKQRDNYTLAVSKLKDALKNLNTSSDLNFKKNIYKWLVFLALYLETPESYQTAIEYAKQYLSGQVEPDTPQRHGRMKFYLAAAYGQKARHTLNENPEPDETKAAEFLQPIANDALEAIRRAKEADPHWKDDLAYLWDPKLHKDDKGEDDLQVFYDNSVLRTQFAKELQ